MADKFLIVGAKRTPFGKYLGSGTVARYRADLVFFGHYHPLSK